MNLRPPPYWPCFASDWLAKEPFRLATLEERGLLFTMLNQVWIGDSVPDNLGHLARLLGLELKQVERGLTKRVLSFFETDGAGRLFCPELRDAKERMLARRQERTEAGKRGGARTRDVRRQTLAKPAAEPLAEPVTEPMAKPEAEPRSRGPSSVEEKRTDVKQNALGSERSDLEDWVNDYDAHSR